ncbi:MAG: hypothetical protein LAO24_00695 [Acidobacteriia bacterium]|nr:hypothetical protein [Terriglobia bacterium]
MAVLLVCAVLLPNLGSAQEQEDAPQITPRDWRITKKKDQGPRALGLLQVSSSGKATLIPIAIRIDGKFYDATAYKADPVPMALDSGTVYEGERTGTSAGLFTVNGALRSTVATNPHPWIGTGMWLPAGTEAPKTGIKAETVPVGIENTDAPPRLTKAGSVSKNDSKPGTTAPSTPDSSSGPSPSGQNQPKQEAPKSAPPVDAKPADKQDSPSSESGSRRGDEPNRPRLRRGRPTEPSPADEDVPGYSNPKKAGSAKSDAGEGANASGTAWKAVQLIPAISDAGGPDPRSYAFEWDKTEAEERHKQMLALATDQILAYVANQAKAKIEAPLTGTKTAAARRRSPKPAQPVMENVQLRTFDLWANNQPVLVLSADAHMPAAAGAVSLSSDSLPQYTITLVARTDIYSNLHTLYAGVTDKFHLDVTPRLELIDVVDADGDARGELLFQETTDTGRGYVIYRATTDKLWKMFDSLNPE